MAEQEKKVNRHMVSFNKATLELAAPLNRDNSYDIGMRVQITDVRTPDNDDGTVDKIYIVKPTGEAIIQNELKRKMPLKDKGSESQKLRSMIYAIWSDVHGGEGSFDKFYSSVHKKIRDNIEMLTK